MIWGSLSDMTHGLWTHQFRAYLLKDCYISSFSCEPETDEYGTFGALADVLSNQAASLAYSGYRLS